MQTASVFIALGGDTGNIVPKVVSAAEIPVLQGIHGDEAVHNIEPLDDEMRDDITGKVLTPREDRARLARMYGGARDGENNRIIEKVYPGAGARLPETIAELELPEILFKPLSRATAKPVVAEAAPAEAPKRGGRKAKGDAEPVPEPAAAPADETDEVKDMFG